MENRSVKDSGSPSLVFLKLGGSLLGDKRRRRAFRRAAVERLAGEIARALERRPQMRLLLAHGGGGFAHFPAKRHRTREGLAGGGGWRGFAETRRGVLEMNARVLDALARGGLRPTLVSPERGADRARRQGALLGPESDPRAVERRPGSADPRRRRARRAPRFHDPEHRRNSSIFWPAGCIRSGSYLHATWKVCILLLHAASLQRRRPSTSARSGLCAMRGPEEHRRIRRALRAAVPPRADRPDVTGGMLGEGRAIVQDRAEDSRRRRADRFGPGRRHGRDRRCAAARPVRRSAEPGP